MPISLVMQWSLGGMLCDEFGVIKAVQNESCSKFVDTDVPLKFPT